MDPLFVVPDEDKEFYTSERCFILELLNNKDRSYSIARARVAPGITTSWHRLKRTSESYYILKGTGLMQVGENHSQQVHAGTLIQIPADTRQRISNTGHDDLLILCVCVPAFGPEIYESLE
jgi:mannose-6-phosphate isomerase-like protein (cupin superfamily)